MYNIAILITCHNRKEITLKCLDNLFRQKLVFDVFLVDDGSTDGTSEEVELNYPMVNIIQGNGDLYWNQGMRLAWQNAIKSKIYDFFIWLNDDTILKEDSLNELLNVYKIKLEETNKPSLVVGACTESPKIQKFSYGGRIGDIPVIPDGSIKECNWINGNFVLVPREIYDKVGILSETFTHAIGDIDYGLRVLKADFKCYTTRSYIGYCSTNKGLAAWCDPNNSLKKRLKLVNSPRGLNLNEYVKFKKRHFGFFKGLITYPKVYFRVFFPGIFLNIKNIKTN